MVDLAAGGTRAEGINRSVVTDALAVSTPIDGRDSKPAREGDIAASGVSDASEASPASGADSAPASEGIDEKAPHAPRVRSDAPDDLEAALDATGLDAERREALRAMYAYLSEHGTARKSDFTGDVYPDHSAGYGSAGGWWNRLGKEALASLPGVSKPAEGRPTWRFSGK